MVKGKRCWGLAAVLLVAAGAVAAQARPDFSGTWVEDRERLTNLLTGKPIAPGPSSGGAMGLQLGDTVVTQTAEAVTIETKIPKFDSTRRFVYTLDGSKSVNQSGAQTWTTTSRWDGNRLVTEGTIFQVTDHGETSWGIKEVMSLEKGELVIESHWTQDGKVTTANRRVYRRAGSGA
jgi:hypothetical protein